MNNFGVIELASAKTTAAPGWAYVPDVVGVNPAVSAALQPANRKRARNAPGLSAGDLSARQEARLRKELEALDKDGGKDNSIPLPVKAGRVQEKHTPNVRKILQSQKTFANHLDDFLALQAQAEAAGGTSAGQSRSAASQGTASNKRSGSSKKDNIASASASRSRQASTPQVEDTQMIDASAAAANLPPVLPPPFKPSPAAHPGDSDPLLASRVPDMPSDAELRRLLAHPPLNYVEARGSWGKEGQENGVASYPTRTFCAVCGYWGRVRCTKCGTRVCALECLETHREECVTRYGL